MEKKKGSGWGKKQQLLLAMLATNLTSSLSPHRIVQLKIPRVSSLSISRWIMRKHKDELTARNSSENSTSPSFLSFGLFFICIFYTASYFSIKLPRLVCTRSFLRRYCIFEEKKTSIALFFLLSANVIYKRRRDLHIVSQKKKKNMRKNALFPGQLMLIANIRTGCKWTNCNWTEMEFE